jgi:hypothetical protein
MLDEELVELRACARRPISSAVVKAKVIAEV